MRLKRVRLFGFKTFADRTELSLDGGLVAVVGPNGCGKSNLVDAILWGLGEGNARHLRAASGQDVIFNGSLRRKPLGYAEVSLLFDNEDGSLPIDTPEVSITRRVTRNGDSDYAINRRSCRLRDVHDLLSDSGLGRAGYAIVGQKEIDAALAASPEDRRAWIDEAAGVQRYRSRKVESHKRLAAAQEHLARVADILSELESQREPLRQEAEVAARYRSTLDSLRTVEIGMLVNEVAKAVREAAQAEERLAEAVRLSQQELSRADALEARSTLLSQQLAEQEALLDGLRARQREAIANLERRQSDLRLAQQRLEGLDELEQSLAQDGEAHLARIDEAEREASLLALEADREQQALEALRQELSGVGVEAKRLTEELKSLDASLQAARQERDRRLRLAADFAHKQERLREVERELEGALRSLPELEEAAQAANDARSEAEHEVQNLVEQLLALEQQLRALREEEDQEAREARKLLAERSTLEGRIRGIESTLDSHEGLNQGSRAVVEAVERGQIQGSFIPVAEAIDVDKELALAIETALGASGNDLIVDDASDAKRAIEWLKQQRAGRATFQPIPQMRPQSPSPELQRLTREPGVVGRASDLVRCEPRLRPVIESLLGRVLIVETLDDALRLARTSGWNRIVTLDGEVQHSSGAVTGGVQSRQPYGIVQRRADLAELQRQLSATQDELMQFEKRVAEREVQRARVAGDTAQVQQARAEAQARLDEAARYATTIQEELKSARRDVERLQAERAQLASIHRPDAPGNEVDSLEAERDGLMARLAARSADASQAEQRLHDAETRVRQAHERSEAARRRLQGAREQEAQRAKRLSHLGPERARLEQQVGELAASIELAKQSLQGVEADLSGAQEKRQAISQERDALAAEARAARQNAAAVGDAAHQAELARARADAKRATHAERLLQEYGLTEEDAIEREGSVDVPPDAATVVGRLRRELKSMGDVNLGAIEAFSRLTQRYEELSAQRDDILEGISQVEAAIRELDRLTRDRFKATFAAVQEQFGLMFQKLFGGGEGSIELTHPDNLLESGVDLHITLPGKRRQPLALLSGGERSLCASAFLFALLKVKPSPLVILDEVDAPLDGANVERFAATLKEFSREIQFLVVTHNHATIAAADAWAGISSQEPGVSMLIPFNPPTAAEPEQLVLT